MRRFSWVLLLLWPALAGCAQAAPAPPVAAAPCAPSGVLFGLVRDAVGAAPASVSEAGRSSSDVREVVARSLDRGLLAGLESACGRDARIGPDALHAGSLVLRYADPVQAEARRASLARLGGYFGDRKILIRFHAATDGRDLVIGYTETSGDPRIVRALSALPAKLAQR